MRHCPPRVGRHWLVLLGICLAGATSDAQPHRGLRSPLGRPHEPCGALPLWPVQDRARTVCAAGMMLNLLAITFITEADNAIAALLLSSGQRRRADPLVKGVLRDRPFAWISVRVTALVQVEQTVFRKLVGLAELIAKNELGQSEFQATASTIRRQLHAHGEQVSLLETLSNEQERPTQRKETQQHVWRHRTEGIALSDSLRSLGLKVQTGSAQREVTERAGKVSHTLSFCPHTSHSHFS